MRVDQISLANLWYENAEGNSALPQFPPPPLGATIFSVPKPPDGFNYQHFRLCVVRHSIYNANGEAIAESESTWNDNLAGEMFKSGDYCLQNAIMIAAISCERCANALLHKYCGNGCPEYSEEWFNIKTECEFCKYMEPTRNMMFINLADRIALAESRTSN